MHLALIVLVSLAGSVVLSVAVLWLLAKGLDVLDRRHRTRSD